MSIHVSSAILFVALTAFPLDASVLLTVSNRCREHIGLYDNNFVETVASGNTTSRILDEGFNGLFRNGIDAEASLAEFSLFDDVLLYGISIVPPGVLLPGDCMSLEECKLVTGTTGFNTPMQIAPLGCPPATCLEDGCADATQFPLEDAYKTYACTGTMSVLLTFCPSGIEDSSQQQQQQEQEQQVSAPVATPSTPSSLPRAHCSMTTSDPAPGPIPQSTPVSTPKPTRAPLQPIPTDKTSDQLNSESLTPTEASMLTTKPVSSTPTLKEIPAVTSSPSDSSNMTSSDKVPGPDTLPPRTNSDATDTTTTFAAPAGQTVYASSYTNGENAQSANTQSSQKDGAGTGTYVATSLGSIAVVAAVAVVGFAYTKKKQIAPTNEEALSPEDLMTPVTQINVL